MRIKQQQYHSISLPLCTLREDIAQITLDTFGNFFLGFLLLICTKSEKDLFNVSAVVMVDTASWWKSGLISQHILEITMATHNFLQIFVIWIYWYCLTNFWRKSDQNWWSLRGIFVDQQNISQCRCFLSLVHSTGPSLLFLWSLGEGDQGQRDGPEKWSLKVEKSSKRYMWRWVQTYQN